MEDQNQTTTRAHQLLKQYDRLAFMAALPLLALAILVYFIVFKFWAAATSNPARELALAVTPNLIAVLIVSITIYIVFRNVRALQSQQDRLDLASEVSKISRGDLLQLQHAVAATAKDLATIIEKSVTARIFTTYDELYATAIHLVNNAHFRIRATSFGLGHSPPSAYYEALTSALARSKASGSRPLMADFYWGTDFARSPEVVHSKAALRFPQLQSKDVLDLVNVYVVDVSWGTDYLIIDDEHMLLTFPSFRGVKTLKFGLAFLGQPKIAAQVSTWLDEFVARQAKPYIEFARDYPPPEETDDVSSGQSREPSTEDGKRRQ